MTSPGGGRGVWVPVYPSMKGFGATIVREASGAARSASSQIQAEMSRGGDAAGRAAGRNIDAGIRAADPGRGVGQTIEANVDGPGLGSRVGSRFASAFKSVAVSGGVLAAAGIGYALKQGFSRLTAIDTAQFKLKSLGNSAQSVESIMTNATAAVKGT